MVLLHRLFWPTSRKLIAFRGGIGPYAALNYVLVEAVIRKPPAGEESSATSKLAEKLLLLWTAARTDVLIKELKRSRTASQRLKLLTQCRLFVGLSSTLLKTHQFGRDTNKSAGFSDRDSAENRLQP